MKNNKKILFLSSPVAGGAERMTLLYAKILKKQGYACHILLTRYPNDKTLIVDFIPKSISYSIIDCKKGWLVPFQLALEVRKYSPDVVFCSQPGNATKILKMKSLGFINTKVIFRDFLMPSNRELSKKDRILCKADVIIAQTQEMKDEIIRFYGALDNNVIVINNPLDKDLISQGIKEASPYDSSYVNYVAINRIDAQKDLVTMLKAFAIVFSKNPLSRLYICGACHDKKYFKQLQDVIINNNLNDCVFFEGLQVNPYKYLYNADTFLLSSIYEGLPNALLEAIYLGTPVVVTRSIPFIEQVVKDGIQGFSVPVGDYMSFSDCMIKSLSINKIGLYNDYFNSETKIVKLFESVLED